MRSNRIRRAALAVALAFAALCAGAQVAGAVVVRAPDGQFLGVTPHIGVAPTSIPGVAAARRGSAGIGFSSNGNLNYHGGQVLHSTAPYLIFWDPGSAITTASQDLFERYFTDVAAAGGQVTNVYAVDRQFTDSTGFADYQQSFSSATQAIADTQPYPGRDMVNCPHAAPTYPHCLTDTQLQAEITRLIAADGLPQGTGANAPIYFIVTPSTVNICADSMDCADNTFCAYHSGYANGPNTVLYATIPMFFNGASSAQNPKACQFDNNPAVQEPNADPADVAIKYLSHEDNETITDPLGTGWWDSNSNQEDGDNCNAYGTFSPANGTNPDAFLPTLGGSAVAGTLFNQSIEGDPYYIQSEWSNGDVNCEMRPSAGTITPSFTVPTGPLFVAHSVSFNPGASTSTKGYTSVSWDFGDGNASFSAGAGAPSTVSHTYSAPGTYTVTLTLVDSRGNLATIGHSLTVNLGTPPTAAFSFSPPGPLVGGSVDFDASGSSDANAGASITGYAWNFGDGSTGSGVAPSHAYAAPGTYSVTLTVTDSLGLTSTPVVHTVEVIGRPSPAFTFSPNDAAPGSTVGFDASGSTDANGGGVTITGYTWDFGDQTTGIGVSPTHVYLAPGTYTVSLTVTNSLGLTSAPVTHTVTVGAPPAAAFTPSPANPVIGAPVTFDASGSSDANGGGVSITAYAWSFGDGSVASGASTSHAYANAGTYPVILTVTDSLGLSASTVHQVVVDELPTASVAVRTVHPAARVAVAFDGTRSRDPDGSIVAYSWSFGDRSAIASGAAPKHTYARPGTYAVRLTVIDGSGHSSSATTMLRVAADSRIIRTSLRSSTKARFLLVAVDGAGVVRLGSSRVTLKRAGTAKLRLALPAAGARALARKHRLRVKLTISYAPVTGPAIRKTLNLVIRS